MSQGAPNAAKAMLIAALIGGTSYVLAWGMDLPQGWDLAWKGTGVGFLTLFAALRARSVDGWLLAAVMLFGVLGDVLLGVNFITGALAFLVGHLVAIGLFLRNRRPVLSRSQLLLAVVLVPATVTIAFLLPTDRTAAPGVALYAAGLSAMAACAWISRFPRFWVGLGAVMFLVSDLLIFARMGQIAPSFEVGLAVWGLYFAGQVMICLGVSGKLAEEGR
ncbi:lysoplasmalogenase [Caulobacter sp. SLTY]|uniref:lysoplasmalogenase n=1 Tax=Caulobacter sp. SLTY TaxID=2683262 RepID=UPI001412B411|nr:lysoplasmalogenase family protein [Caulobacter sp. SLTY]NBB14468.1 lysoplasmalogenase [Caulobacter sp. SLTY]